MPPGTQIRILTVADHVLLREGIAGDGIRDSPAPGRPPRRSWARTPGRASDASDRLLEECRVIGSGSIPSGARSAGAFPIDNSQWDPEERKPHYANSACRAARWTTSSWRRRRRKPSRRHAECGRRRRPVQRSASKLIIERRNAILRRYLPAVNPVVDVRLSAPGTLTIRNAAVDAGVCLDAHQIRGRVVASDNATGVATRLGETSASQPSVSAPQDLPSTTGTFIRAEISANGGPESWSEPRTPIS
jgi:hypothetical protein